MEEKKFEKLKLKALESLKRNENASDDELFEQIDIYHAELIAQNEELQRAQSELLKINDEFSILFEHAPIAYILIDKKFNILRSNTKAKEQLHLGYNDFSKNLFKYFAQGQIEQFLNYMREKEFSKQLEVQLTIGNDKRFFQLFVNEYDDNKLLISLIDIQKEKEQARLLVKQAILASKGEMLSMISHQWRQPLSIVGMVANSIRISIELDEISIDELKESSLVLEKTVQRMSETIDEFLTLGNNNSKIEKIIVENFVEEFNTLIKSRLTNNNIKLIVKQQIKCFYTNSRYLIQVVLNIINNSIDAYKSNLSTSKNVNITFLDIDNYTKIIIQDKAGGIDKKIIDKIFDPYFTTKSELNGTGLGLYMSKLIIEDELEGKITVQNEDGGLQTTIKLPKVNKNA